MTNDYEEGPWAPAEIFVGGGQIRKRPPHGKKAPPPPPPPINVAEKDSTWRKSNKKALQIASNRFFNFLGGGRPPTLAPPPAGAHGGGAIATFSSCGFLFATFFSKWGRLFCFYGGWCRPFFWGCPLPYKIFFNIAHHRFISHDL